ncbi:bifunctional DNA primase/polymerase [Streptomyces hebeiensis]|uniref:Bifunctional DNA primase/polymerase n=1 Tax=Streptomyces hebeiensis TaxID=229486 RepID=A0ABN1UVW6_9ACTN
MPQAHRSSLLSAALSAAERGWAVFPLVPGDKRPALHSERRCPGTGVCVDGHRMPEQRATTDPARIARCWDHAPYNIGVAAGPSGLVVVDLDVPKGPDDLPPADGDTPGARDGSGVFAALCGRHGQEYPGDTYTVRTVSGGTHLYYAAPDGIELRNTAGKLGWKVDTRAHGGYVVGAGSVLTGKAASYTAVHEAPVAPLPGWLADLLRPAPLPPQKPVTVALAAERRGKWLQAAVNGELERVATSPAHEHNNALYLASVALGQLVAGGALAEEQVTGWLTDAALRVGQKEPEARRTVASGLRAGARRPRAVAA